LRVRAGEKWKEMAEEAGIKRRKLKMETEGVFYGEERGET